MAIGTTAAIIGAGVLGAGASMYGSKKASDAQVQGAENASAATLQATRETIASNEKMNAQNRADLAPWREAGQYGLNNVIDMVKKGPGEFVPANDPGYEFGYKNFIESPTLAMASATGKLRSGATQKALTRYASDYASTKYDNFLDRYYKSMMPSQSLAGIGQNATNQTVAAGQNTAGSNANALMNQGNAISSIYQNAGNARASGYINQSNAISGGVNNAVGAYTMYNLLRD